MNSCEICGRKAVYKVIDMWAFGSKGEWTVFRPFAERYRCKDHNRKGLIKTSDRDIFDSLQFSNDNVILI